MLIRRSIFIFANIAFIVLSCLFSPFSPDKVQAATLGSRSITVGTSVPGANTTHQFGFDFIGNTNVGSVQFEYCSNSPLLDDSCTEPGGIDATGATLDAQTGETGFSIYSTPSTNKIILTRPSTPPTVGASSVYSFSSIVNPSTPTTSTFVRLSTYSSVDASGTPIDTGAVVFSTAGGVSVGAYVPPYLTFCVGITVGSNCSTSVGNFIDLGPLSINATKAASSQMAVSTNDPGGYIVSIHGTTMTSGNNVIPPPSTPSFSSIGSSQFGINLRANAAPAVGLDPSGIGTGFAMANYNIPNKFYFVPDTNIASSILPTDFTVFTISYIANIAKGQAVGYYSTTSSFVATVSF